jgi:hypothetical protein
MNWADVLMPGFGHAYRQLLDAAAPPGRLVTSESMLADRNEPVVPGRGDRAQALNEVNLDYHRVRARWNRGFIGFRRVRSIRIAGLAVPVLLKSRFWSRGIDRDHLLGFGAFSACSPGSYPATALAISVAQPQDTDTPAPPCP